MVKITRHEHADDPATKWYNHRHRLSDKQCFIAFRLSALVLADVRRMQKAAVLIRGS